jgi:hypothetical protein
MLWLVVRMGEEGDGMAHCSSERASVNEFGITVDVAVKTTTVEC